MNNRKPNQQPVNLPVNNLQKEFSIAGLTAKKTLNSKSEFKFDFFTNLNQFQDEPAPINFDTSKTIQRYNVTQWNHLNLDLDRLWDQAFNEYVCFG